MPNKLPPVITVDGPSSSGKGTISLLLARRLGWNFLDSGAIYRTLAWLALRENIELIYGEKLVELAANLEIKIIVDDALKVFYAGQEITDLIRSEECGLAASKVSAIPEVRSVLLPVQRKFRQAPGLVTDGRDMGTVVFPDAEVKIFLTASLAKRAKRRYQQLQEQGIHATLQEVSEQLRLRDKRDQERTIAPLVLAPGAKIIDTTNLGVNEVLEQLLVLVRQVF